MRQARRIEKDAIYHVSARANRKEFIFETPHVKELFLATIERAKRKYDFAVTNFVIMGNHFHLLIKPLFEENLSKIMQWILSQFAKTFNRAFGYCGHVWGERFFSKILAGPDQYRKVSQYIDENPAKAGISRGGRLFKYSGRFHRKKSWSQILDLFLMPFT